MTVCEEPYSLTGTLIWDTSLASHTSSAYLD